MRTRSPFRVVALACGAALLSMLSVGCEKGRFPTCETNKDCAERDGGAGAPVCYNLKCVQCRYDSDCERGTCSSSNECEALVGPTKRDEPDAGDAPEKWEHGSWDSCAAECKDPACIKACDEKFPKNPDKKPPDKKAPDKKKPE